MVNCLHGLTQNQGYHKGLSLAHCYFWSIQKVHLVHSEGLKTNARLIADDVSIFYVVNNINLSANNLDGDLSKINVWPNQWKMTFNPDLIKQSQEVIISRKLKTALHPPLNFNNNFVKQVLFQTHLDFHLGGKLDFREHLQNMFKEVKKRQSAYCVNHKITYIELQQQQEFITPLYGLIQITKTFYMARPLIVLFMKSSNRFNIMQALQ